MLNLHLKNIQDRLVHLPSHAPPCSLLSDDADTTVSAMAFPCLYLARPAPSKPHTSVKWHRGAAQQHSLCARTKQAGRHPNPTALLPTPLGGDGLSVSIPGCAGCCSWKGTGWGMIFHSPQSAAVSPANVPLLLPAHTHRFMVWLETNNSANQWRGGVLFSHSPQPRTGVLMNV